MKEFFEKIAEILEVDSVDAQTRFRNVDGWGSL